MLRRLLAACPTVALLIACASPTLPLPPPEAIAVGAMPDPDHVTLTATCGGAPRNVFVSVVNEASYVPRDKVGVVALTDPVCGKWDATVYAHSGDWLDITYQLDGQISQPALLRVP
jgi:hypothetical protein